MKLRRNVYGNTDSGEDLYYRFRHTYQGPHERLSDFVRRLEDLLQQVVRKEGIPTKHIDSVRLDQILRGTREDGLMLWRLQLRERAPNPPPFHSLIREIREEEDRFSLADAVVPPKKESRSPYASPVVVVRKKSGKVRMCVDYRTLNRRT
uniref:Paraneoplastic antigen Ma-like C-terminal domain-containing protein n=1 Tax=Pelusios castaneus TaxID=367368 RepID=A0A8C8VK06_9SAUR